MKQKKEVKEHLLHFFSSIAKAKHMGYTPFPSYYLLQDTLWTKVSQRRSKKVTDLAKDPFPSRQ
jgi:hypothetical protein